MHLSPQCLLIVKHLNKRLVAYLNFDTYSYGTVSLGRYCSLSLEKMHGIWQLKLIDQINDQIYGLRELIDGLNYVVFEYMDVDPDDLFESLELFESHCVYFSQIDLKINGTRIIGQAVNSAKSQKVKKSKSTFFFWHNQ